MRVRKTKWNKTKKSRGLDIYGIPLCVGLMCVSLWWKDYYLSHSYFIFTLQIHLRQTVALSPFLHCSPGPSKLTLTVGPRSAFCQVLLIATGSYAPPTGTALGTHLGYSALTLQRMCICRTLSCFWIVNSYREEACCGYSVHLFSLIKWISVSFIQINFHIH